MDKIERIGALKVRTKDFLLRIIRLFQALPKTDEAKIIGKQLLRSATSVAANYRAAGRTRSDAEFFSKISIAVEEADEALFWLELLTESDITESHLLESIIDESEQMMKIMKAIRHNCNQRKNLSTLNPESCILF